MAYIIASQFLCQAEDGIRDRDVTGVQTCALPIYGGDPKAVEFPRALPDRPFDFSFSGLKTSVVTFLEKAERSGDLPPLADVAASLQEEIVDVLVDKTFNAVDQTGARIVGGGGGVLDNRRLPPRLGGAG